MNIAVNGTSGEGDGDAGDDARRPATCGRRGATTSMTATTLNGNATHVTHNRWAESGRCSACGRMPTLTSATASSAVVRPVTPPAGAAQHGEASSAAVPTSITKNHRNSVRAAQVGEPPPRRDLLGDRLQGAVEALPARRAGQLAAAAQAEHRVDHHALERRRGTGHHEVHPHRQQADEPASRTGRRAARCRQSSQPATSPTAITRSGRYESASPARRPATTHARRRRAGSARWMPRTANTVAHSVSASPPFQAIAVRPTGVST